MSLGIICIHAWRVQGWAAAGIHSPGHILIQVSTTGELAILDPFHQARLLDESNLRERFTAAQEDSTENSMNGVAPVSNREILLRLQNNIRIRARQRGDTALALRTTESMLVLAKDAPVFRLEIAALKAKAGEIKAALSDIETLLDGRGAEELHEQAELLQATLKGRLN